MTPPSPAPLSLEERDGKEEVGGDAQDPQGQLLGGVQATPRLGRSHAFPGLNFSFSIYGERQAFGEDAIEERPLD